VCLVVCLPVTLPKTFYPLFSLGLPASALEGVRARCAQAYGALYVSGKLLDVNSTTGSEIFVGCSNGELMRFALQADDPNKVRSISMGNFHHLNLLAGILHHPVPTKSAE